MTPHLCLDVHEASQVGEARRLASRMASDAGFDETTTGRVSIIVTELAGNLARHAQRGRLLLGVRAAGPTMVEIVSMDHGPGMADVETCLRDGFSTGATPGTGLGAARRLADHFSIFSVPGQGTVIAARVGQRGAGGRELPPEASTFAIAGIALAAPGETVCGDAWQCRVDHGRASIIVADGLGHGPVAAEASDAALRVFDKLPGRRPAEVLDQAHAAMRSTRGAAVSIFELDADAGRLVFAGAGNITGRIISGVKDQSLLSQNGTLGLQIRKLQDISQDWPSHAIVVMHSDGLITRWDLNDTPALLRHDPLLIAGWLICHHLRGRDDATVVVARRT